MKKQLALALMSMSETFIGGIVCREFELEAHYVRFTLKKYYFKLFLNWKAR